MLMFHVVYRVFCITTSILLLNELEFYHKYSILWGYGGTLDGWDDICVESRQSSISRRGTQQQFGSMNQNCISGANDNMNNIHFLHDVCIY